MKVYMTTILLAALGATVSASPQPEDAIGTKAFIANGKHYVGENHAAQIASAGKREVDSFLLNKRCSCGTTCYDSGNACIIGNCECEGQRGCYSCNGGPPVCQDTGKDGVPTSCYQ